MFSEIGKGDTREIQNTEKQNFQDIKSESGMTVGEANKYWDNIFNKKTEVSDGYNSSYEARLSRTPLDNQNGHWEGKHPESKYVPSDETEESKAACDKTEVFDGYHSSYEARFSQTPLDNQNDHWEGKRAESKYVPSDETEKGKAACDKLAEKNMDGIEYKNGEPDFSKCAEATVEIPNMTENRSDYYDKDGNLKQGNFSQADLKCSEQWNASQKDGRTDWKPEDVRKWRRENNCSWHERCDTHTMDLVPQEIHSYFSHFGGCAECKIRDAANLGGEFDE